MSAAAWHPGYAPVDELCAVYGLTRARCYRLAYRYEWRRYVLDGTVRYHRGDVYDTPGLTDSATPGDPDVIVGAVSLK